MNNSSTTKDPGFQAGVPNAEGEQDPRSAQPDKTDPSIDVEVDDMDEGDDEAASRQAGGRGIDPQK
jgi:hypothetical protein